MAMLINHDKQLYDEWNKCWEGSVQNKKLTLLRQFMFRAKRNALRQVIKGLKINTVLEVGCGLGYTMQVFHDMGLDYIGIDVSQNAVAICRNKGLRAVHKRLEDVTEQYDLISNDGMLEHFLYFEPYAKHLMRVSRRYVLLIQPNHGSFCGRNLVYLAELFHGNKNIFEYNYRIIDFIDAFERNGFVVIKNEAIFFDIFRLLLFEKKQ